MHKLEKLMLDVLSPPCRKYMFSRRHHLIFLPIPKNANSFLRAIFLMNHENAADFEPERNTAHEYLKKRPSHDFFVAHKKTLEDPAFTKFVVIRNPAKRLVSGYLDKFAKKGRDEVYVGKFCTRIGQKLRKDVTPECLTFQDFCHYQFSIADWRRDGHYRSQSYYMRGINFDWYGDVDDMKEVLKFLEGKGLDTRLPNNRNPSIDKKTKYDDSALETKPQRLRLNQLHASNAFPPYGSFFDRDLLQMFLKAYADDVNTYLQVKQISNEKYTECFV